MKLNKSILIAGAALVSFASCENKVVEPSQSDIDKEVAVKVMEVRNQLQADCDASIDAEAMRLADSVIIARGNRPAPVAAPAPKQAAPAPAPKTKTKTKTTKTPPPPPPPVKADPKKDKMGGKKVNTSEAKKDKMSGKATQKKIEEATEKKKNKMSGK